MKLAGIVLACIAVVHARLLFDVTLWRADLSMPKLALDDPNIMDTFAGAYYAKGDNKNAVYWEKEVLKKTKK